MENKKESKKVSTEEKKSERSEEMEVIKAVEKSDETAAEPSKKVNHSEIDELLNDSSV
jgi:hypothetical protein